jgi:hypothetical protein
MKGGIPVFIEQLHSAFPLFHQKVFGSFSTAHPKIDKKKDVLVSWISNAALQPGGDSLVLHLFRYSLFISLSGFALPSFFSFLFFLFLSFLWFTLLNLYTQSPCLSHYYSYSYSHLHSYLYSYFIACFLFFFNLFYRTTRQ